MMSKDTDLGEAETAFKQHPSRETAANLLTVASEYAHDGELSFDGFDSIVCEVRDWLQNEAA